MDFKEALINVRGKVVDAVRLNIIGKELYEATLIQLMKECESNRQRCLRMKSDFERQAAKAEAEAQGYLSVYTLIYQVLNGFVSAAERQVEEELEAEKEEKEEQETMTKEEKEAINNIKEKQVADKKKTTKKRATKKTTRKTE